MAAEYYGVLGECFHLVGCLIGGLAGLIAR